MITIDGTTYDAGIFDLKRGEERKYKYDEVTSGGTKVGEILGRYRTYTITIWSIDVKVYNALRSALATNRISHKVVLPVDQEEDELEARVELGDESLQIIYPDGTCIWEGLELKITGINPLPDGQ